MHVHKENKYPEKNQQTFTTISHYYKSNNYVLGNKNQVNDNGWVGQLAGASIHKCKFSFISPSIDYRRYKSNKDRIFPHLDRKVLAIHTMIVRKVES
jgi:hypothetical protein